MPIDKSALVTIKPEIVDAIRAAQTGPDLYQYLQSAIELEHSTIPPYLTAFYSIKPGSNQAAAQIIRSIVVEEMLHMTIAANVLNAIGGTPVINRPGFIPTYPGTLPMSVDGGLVVPLEPLSLRLISEVFMRIELPKKPQRFPDRLMLAATPEYNTIGEFYDAIIERLVELGEGVFTGDPARQVVDPIWFPVDELFAVTDVQSAVRALTIVKEQGEGWSTDPMDGDGEPAHYYRFEEIVRGHELRKDPTVEQGYSFSGPPVPLDSAGIMPLVPNSRVEDYPAGSLARSGVTQADYTYTSLLNALHDTFNGDPARLRTAIAVMYELRLVILEKVTNQVLTDGPHKGDCASPSFAYTPTAAFSPAVPAAE